VAADAWTSGDILFVIHTCTVVVESTVVVENTVERWKANHVVLLHKRLRCTLAARHMLCPPCSHADVVSHILHSHSNEGMVLTLPAIHLYRLWHAPAGGRPASKTHQGPPEPG